VVAGSRLDDELPIHLPLRPSLGGRSAAHTLGRTCREFVSIRETSRRARSDRSASGGWSARTAGGPRVTPGRRTGRRSPTRRRRSSE
jgi:hypothetical protein